MRPTERLDRLRKHSVRGTEGTMRPTEHTLRPTEYL